MEGAVSIALFASNFSDLKFEYKALAPNWKILDKFKKKVISEEKFILAYKEQLNELNPASVVEHLNFLTGGEEPVLMCHCSKTKFCHRHLLADWLENKLGIHIEEFGSSDHIRKDGYLIKKEEPSLFEKED
jgi:uncharacterized protein YeaO (DUF488 family)